MYATCIDTCSTLIYINYIHIQVRGGGSGPPGPPPASALEVITLMDGGCPLLSVLIQR